MDVDSDWFSTYNAVPANATFSAKGWFHSQDWTRESLREVQMTQTTGTRTISSVYECPSWRPFWLIPVDYVGIIFLVVSFLSMCAIVAVNFIQTTSIYADRIEVESVRRGAITGVLGGGGVRPPGPFELTPFYLIHVQVHRQLHRRRTPLSDS